MHGLSGSFIDKSINNLNNSFTMVVSTSSLCRCWIWINDFISIKRRYIIEPYNSSHHSQHDTAIRVGIKPFRKDLSSWIYKLFLRVNGLGVNLKDLVYWIDKRKFQVFW